MIQSKYIIYLFLLLISSCIFANGKDSTKYNYSYENNDWIFKWNDSLSIAINKSSQFIDTVYKNLYIEEKIESDYDSNYSRDCISSMDYKLLSIVGSIVSYEVTSYSDCGVHPTGGPNYESINISRNNEQAWLTDLFNERDIYESFMNDSLIKYYLTNKNPKDLAELVDNLEGGCEIKFMWILNNFAIKEIKKNKAIIEFGLGYGCEVQRENYTIHDISIKIPKEKEQLFSKIYSAL